jgi:hypothetical protein
MIQRCHCEFKVTDDGGWASIRQTIGLYDWGGPTLDRFPVCRHENLMISPPANGNFYLRRRCTEEKTLHAIWQAKVGLWPSTFHISENWCDSTRPLEKVLLLGNKFERNLKIFRCEIGCDA